jgi:hypothetical protein
MNTSEMATCPYNPSHCFAKHKLFPHLERCKDAKRGRKLYHCKKDTMVMFFYEDKLNHYSACSYCSQSAQLNSTLNSQIDKLKDKKIEMNKKKDNFNSIIYDLNVTNEESVLDFNVNDIVSVNNNSIVEALDLGELSEKSDFKNSENETILY